MQKRRADRKLLQRTSPQHILCKVHQRVLKVVEASPTTALQTTMLAVAQMTYGALSSIYVLTSS